MTNEERKALVNEARLDAKAFRENTVYTADGDAIRLIANADRLDQYSDQIEADGQRIAELEARIAHMAGVNNEFLDPDHYWYRQGKDDGIEQERGNVVEWLRGPDPYPDGQDIADDIEAGEHLK